MEEEDTREYEVLVNGEEQYSLWLAGQAVPNGWRQVGPRGKKQICLDYVKEVWTDMRPLSVRKAMEAHAKAQEEAKARQAQEAAGEAATPAQADSAAHANGATGADAGTAHGEAVHASSSTADAAEARPPPQAGNDGAGAATGA